jgi:predicted dehydrogenase
VIGEGIHPRIAGQQPVGTESPRIALVGCGAIAESFYMPVLAGDRALRKNLILVDKDEIRAASLAEKYGVANWSTDYAKVVSKVEGAVIATPPHLHYEMVMAFLRAGTHVLCEKPLAESRRHVDEMIKLAGENKVEILVNNTRRLFPSYRKVKELIASGAIGRVKSVQYYEGAEFSWPTVSGFYSNAKAAGPKGVLLDRGAHVLDLICWWLEAKPNLLSYYDDSFGGCEALATVRFEFEMGQGEVMLSWFNRLQNCYVIQGERGFIEGEISDWQRLTMKSDTEGRLQDLVLRPRVSESDFANQLLDNFRGVLAGEDKPIVSAAGVADSIAWIEECYANRRRFEMPWMNGKRGK